MTKEDKLNLLIARRNAIVNAGKSSAGLIKKLDRQIKNLSK